MNDKQTQADALDRFLDGLVHNSQVEMPDELDRDTARFARDLVQALHAPSLDAEQQARIRQAVQSNSLANTAPLSSNGDFLHKKDHTHMLTTMTKPPSLARSGWSVLVAAAMLIAVFAGFVTLLYDRDQLNGILPGDNGSTYGLQITPTVVPETTGPEMTQAPFPPLDSTGLTEVTRWGRGEVNQVLWSPDGASLALAGARGVWLYASGDLTLEPELIAAADIRSAQYLANGDLVALTGPRDKSSFRYMNLSTGQVIMDIPNSEERQVNALALSHDGRYLAGAVSDGTVEVWHAATGNVVARLLVNTRSPVVNLAFSPDGSWLAAQSSDFVVRLWHVPDNNWLAVDGQAPVILGSTRSTEMGAWLMAFDAAGDRLAVVIGDDVEIWDVTQQTLASTLETDDLWSVGGVPGIGVISDFVVSPDGQIVITTGQITRQWTVPDGTAIEHPAHGRAISVALSPDGQRIAILEWDGTLQIWDPALQDVQDGVVAHARAIGDIEYSADGQLLAVNSLYSGVYVFDAPTGVFYSMVHQPQGDSALGMAFDPVGDSVATVDASGTVWLWDAISGEAIGSLLPPTDSSPEIDHSTMPFGFDLSKDRIAFSADGRLIAAAGSADDNPVYVWDVAGAELLHTFTTLYTAASVQDMVFNPDGSHLAVTYASQSVPGENVVEVWTLADESRQVLEGHTGPVYAVAFSPDGTQIATGSQDATARLWDVASGETIAVFQHTSLVTSVAFSPDGSLLLTDAMGQMALHPAPVTTVTLWELATGEVLATYSREGMVVATFAPDGAHIAVGNSDGTISLLGVDVSEPLYEITPEVSGFQLMLAEDMPPLRVQAPVRVVDRWYADGTWWYAVVSKGETALFTVRENQLMPIPDLPTPVPQ